MGGGRNRELSLTGQVRPSVLEARFCGGRPAPTCRLWQTGDFYAEFTFMPGDAPNTFVRTPSDLALLSCGQTIFTGDHFLMALLDASWAGVQSGLCSRLNKQAMFTLMAVLEARLGGWPSRPDLLSFGQAIFTGDHFLMELLEESLCASPPDMPDCLCKTGDFYGENPKS